MTGSSGSIRVLYVDDDPEFADLTATFLERKDDRLTVETATSADEGLDRLAGDVDCVVSDYDMPETDGIEFLEIVREAHPDLPFILFTGEENETVAGDAISAGVTDYLQKETSTDRYAALASRVTDAAGHRDREAAVDWQRTIIRNIGEGVYVLDRDYTFQFVDYRIGEVDALSAEEWTGRAVSYLAEIDLLSADDVARIEDGVDRVLAGESAEVNVDIEPAVPESTRVVGVRLTPLDVETGEELVLATTRDLTGREHRRRKLERYETIVEAMDDAAFVVADGWTVEYANQSALDSVGASPDEVDGQPIIPLVEEYTADDGDPDRFAGALERAFDPDDPATFSERLDLSLDVDGDALVFEYQFSPIVEDGSVEAVAVTSRDVTDRRERERKLEALHDATRDLAGAESHQAIAEITVETARDVLGLPISGLHLYDEENDVLEPAAVTGEAVDLLEEIPTFEPGESVSWQVFQSGEMRQFDDVSTVPERYNEDTAIRSELVVPVGEYGVMEIGSTAVGAFGETDLSLARILAANAEAAMARADRERELARQNERLGEFASIVSHDLRNPLQVADGRLELIREEHDSDHLDALESALDRMERLIDDLLRLARKGESVENPEPVDLGALAERCWETVRTAEATLVVDTDRTIRADPDRLRQLLENLLRNCVEHGGTEVTIEIGDLERGFYVADDGPGIPETDRDTIFEVGYSTTEDGTGFGLSIVQEIVDAHGWTIGVTDGDSGGARFEFRGVAVES